MPNYSEQAVFIEEIKKNNGIGNKEIGGAIDRTADSLRMSVKRNSLTRLEIEEIERLFGSNKDSKIDRSLRLHRKKP